MHTPVFLEEAVSALDVQPGKRYIDATVGEGGHTKRILERGGKVLAIDWDKEQLARLQQQIHQPGVIFAQGNFANIELIAQSQQFMPVDGILIDLGLSMKQLDEGGRGLSFRKLDEPLDMRLDSTTEQTAADLINYLSSDELYEIFAGNSEEIYSRPIADAVFLARRVRSVQKVKDLITIIDDVFKDKPNVAKEPVYARIWQALRIAVNEEFDNLKQALNGAVNITQNGGKIVIITFHSLEDRLVKQFARSKQTELKMQRIDVASQRPLRSFEKSAKLRILSKL